jgi:signal transduction histidine kinase
MQTPRIIAEEISKIDIRLKPKEYSRSALRVICRQLGYHFGSIILVDEKGNGRIFSAYNLPENYPQMVNRVSAPVLSSPSGIAIQEGKSVIVNNVFSESRLEPWYDLLNQLDIKTIVWIPLFSKGKAFGTYNLYDHRQREISEQEIVILNQLSILFSVSIQSNEYIDEIQGKSKRLEEEIARRKKVELELRIAKEQAEAANRAKNEFLDNISHEVRTPMNAIMGFSNILLEQEEDPGKKETFKIIQEAGEALLTMINDILDAVRIESGKLELEPDYFSLNQILKQVYRMFSARAEQGNLEFTVTTDPSVPAKLYGDAYRLKQVIFNLVMNAFKFTPEGRISVDCSYDHENSIASIKVSDTGIGIPDEKLELIFALFTQADTSSTRRYGGIGLGLTIAYKLVEQMGGGISVKSEPGVGSTFTVELPLPGSSLFD